MGAAAPSRGPCVGLEGHGMNRPCSFSQRVINSSVGVGECVCVGGGVCISYISIPCVYEWGACMCVCWGAFISPAAAGNTCVNIKNS